jgi:uncharacterized membrane protein YgcG
MSVDLSGYQTAVGVCQCVKLDIPDYGILRLSTYYKVIFIEEEDGIEYQYEPAGVLLNISEGVSELRASSIETVIGLTGIPVQYAIIVQAQPIRGSRVDIYRVFTDPITDEVLDIAGNPVFMFRGVVVNYGFSETINEFSQDASLVVTLSCASLVDMLQRKITGRRTNNESQLQFYPGDSSFSRITAIIGKPFDFGSPVSARAAQVTQTDTIAFDSGGGGGGGDSGGGDGGGGDGGGE